MTQALTDAAAAYGKHLVETDVGAVTSHCPIQGSDGEHVMVVAVRCYGRSKPEQILARAQAALIDAMTGK